MQLILLKVFPATVVAQDRGSYGVVHLLLLNFKQSLPLLVGVRHAVSDLHDETQELLLDQGHHFPQLVKLVVDLKQVFTMLACVFEYLYRHDFLQALSICIALGLHQYHLGSAASHHNIDQR